LKIQKFKEKDTVNYNIKIKEESMVFNSSNAIRSVFVVSQIFKAAR
jgi:hypothetical protein